MTSSLAYKRTAFLHQFDQLGERSDAAICDTLLGIAGAAVLLVKAMDGTDWMAAFDRSPLAISGPGRLAQLTASCAARGVDVIPWVVATGPGDGAAHAALGPRLVVDLEPYAGFWQSDYTGILSYFTALRAGGVTELLVSIDPRQSALRALGVSGWAPHVDGLLPQCYWTDFQQPEPVVEPLIDLEVHQLHAQVFPVWPYNAAPVDLQAAWQHALLQKITGCCLWKLGMADAAQLAAFAALPLPAPKRQWDNNDLAHLGQLLFNRQPDGTPDPRFVEMVAYLAPLIGGS